MGTLFYLSEVFGVFKLIGALLSIIFGAIFIGNVVMYPDIVFENEKKLMHRTTKISFYIAIVSLFIAVFIPSREAFLLMVGR